MASPQGVAFALEGAKLQLATITVPLAAQPAPQPTSAEPPDLLPPPLPPGFAALSAALAAVRGAASAALPFAATVAGSDSLRVVCQKARVADVFKLLRAQQGALGIVVKDVKSQVSLLPPAGEELQAAVSAGLAAALRARGWWQLDEERLLGASPLQPSAGGQPVTCTSVSLRVHAWQPAPGSKEPPKLLLLVLPEQVEFQHPACRPGASLDQRSARLAGTMCTLLPDLRPAIVQRVRAADAPTLARLRPLWAAHGHPLPAQVEALVEVSLDCDPDAPSFPYAPCRVLGQYGLQSVAAKLSSPGVQAALARLRDDLAASPFKFLGDGLKLGPTAHEWFPSGAPPARGRQLAAAEGAGSSLPPVGFVTARQHEQQRKQQGGGGSGAAEQPGGPALGAAIETASFKAGAGAGAVPDSAGDRAGGASQQQTQQRQRKQYAPVDATLQAAFEAAKREHADAERPAGASAVPKPAAALGPSQGTASASRQPTLAMRQAAAAAAGGTQKPTVPVFKKAGPSAVPAAAPKKAAAAQKRAAPGGKPPTAAKKPKPARAATPGTAAAAAAATPRKGKAAAGPGASPGPSVPPSAAGTPAASAMPSTSAAAGLPAASAADAGGMGAAAPAAKAPPKPRAKAADIDVAAVTAKVQQMHAAGTLGKLTIPEMKAYLKSIKQPVGGKKGELEERVRASLGGAAAPAAAAGTAVQA